MDLIENLILYKTRNKVRKIIKNLLLEFEFFKLQKKIQNSHLF